MGCVKTSANRGNLKNIGERLFEKMNEGVSVKTDTTLIKTCAEWCQHPNTQGDKLMLSLSSGGTDEREALAMSLEGYLSSSKSDSGFTNTIVRNMAEELIPSTSPDKLVNIAQGLRNAGLASHDAVTSKRDELKTLRNGDEAQQKLWEQLKAILPAKPMVSKITDAFKDAIGFTEGP